MIDHCHDAMRGLLDPTASRRRRVLLELEHTWEADQLDRFSAAVAGAPPAIQLDLCAALGTATTAPLIDLVGSFANAADASLRRRALETLENIAASRRIATLVRLLASPFAETVAASARLLGASGFHDQVVHLVAPLRQDRPEVAIAALCAIEQLGLDAVVDAVVDAIGHGHPDVRTRAITLIAAKVPRRLPRIRLVEMLRADAAAKVRCAAASALAATRDPTASGALCAALIHDPDPAVRCAAAIAASAFRQPHVVRCLITHAAGADDTSIIVRSCRRALLGMDSDVVLPECRQLVTSGSPEIQAVAAHTIGRCSFEAAQELLATAACDPQVRCALLTGIGIGRWQRGWATVRRFVGPERTEALAAVDALGRLLNRQTVSDFALLLSERHESWLREAVLTGLARFGRSVPLPAEVLSPLMEVLGDRTLRATLTIEVLALLQGEEAVAALSDQAMRQDDAGKAAIAALVQRTGGDPARAIDLAKGRWPVVCRMLATMAGTDIDALPAILRICSAAVAGEDLAFTALTHALRLDPGGHGRVVAACEGTPAQLVVVLHAWGALDAEDRHASDIDVAQILSAPAAEVRQAMLAQLGGARLRPLLPLVIDLAMLDRSEQVRQTAREATRRLVEA